MSNIVVTNPANNISVLNNGIVISLGIQGAPGAGLPAGGIAEQALIKNSDVNYDYSWQYIGNTIVTETAGTTISGLKIVYLEPTSGNVFYADKDTLSTIDSIVGISIQAGTIGNPINIVTDGKIIDSSWSWDLTGSLALFLNNNGDIIQGEPSSFSASVKIGCVLSATSILVRL